MFHVFYVDSYISVLHFARAHYGSVSTPLYARPAKTWNTWNTVIPHGLNMEQNTEQDVEQTRNLPRLTPEPPFQVVPRPPSIPFPPQGPETTPYAVLVRLGPLSCRLPIQ